MRIRYSLTSRSDRLLNCKHCLRDVIQLVVEGLGWDKRGGSRVEIRGFLGQLLSSLMDGRNGRGGTTPIGVGQFNNLHDESSAGSERQVQCSFTLVT